MRTGAIVVLIVSVLLCGIGACLLAGAGGLFQFDANRQNTWIPVTGTVTRMRESTSTDSDGHTSTTYCPTVAYTSTDGNKHVVDTNECTFPPAFHNGDAVELLVNPANSEQVQIKNGLGRAFTIGGLSALGLAGLACILPALLGFIVSVFLFVRARGSGRAGGAPVI